MAFTYLGGRDKGQEVRDWGNSISEVIDTGSDIYQKYKDKKIQEDLRKKHDEQYNMIDAVDTDSSAVEGGTLPPVYSVDTKKPKALSAPTETIPTATQKPKPAAATPQPGSPGYLKYLQNPTYVPAINPYEPHPLRT